MGFDSTYRITCSLTMNDGRKLSLRQLNQKQTYWGLLGGLPNTGTNTELVSRELRTATEQHCFRDNVVHLIPPLRRDYGVEPGDHDDVPQSGNRKPEWLPRTQRLGHFESTQHASECTQDFSVLTVLWFQDDYAMPIAQDIESALIRMDWRNLATDLKW